MNVFAVWGICMALLAVPPLVAAVRGPARTWWMRLPLPAGPLRTVRGFARGAHHPSPFERVACLLTWIRLEEAAGDGARKRCELAVGDDFLLQSPEGVFTVRIAGLHLVGRAPLVEGGAVLTVPDGPLGEVVAAFGPTKTVFWSELHVRDGDELEVTGVCREEPALASAAGRGPRDAAPALALTGAGGRLDVRLLG